MRDPQRIDSGRRKEKSMRDPERIPRILEELAIYWEKNPDLRLGQIVSNIASLNKVADVFHLEDDILEYELHEANNPYQDVTENADVAAMFRQMAAALKDMDKRLLRLEGRHMN